MAARSMWKGELKVGSTIIPVKLFAAVEDVAVRFNVLQRSTKSRVKQQITSEDKTPVEKSQIRKGYEIDRGTFVIIEPEELQDLKPKESRTVNFLRFVPISVVGPEWYERPYYLAPDG